MSNKYDLILITKANSTADLENNKQYLADSELVYCTGNKALYIKDGMDIVQITTGEIGSIDISGKLDKGGYVGTAKDLDNSIKANTTAISKKADATTVTSLSEKVNQNSTLITNINNNKLEKGGYTGTAKNLETLISTNTTAIAGLRTSKVDKGTYPYDNLNNMWTKVQANETNLGNKLDKGTFSGTAKDLDDRITANASAIEGINVSGKLDKGTFEGTAETLDTAIKANTSALSSKVEAGGYSGNAKQLDDAIKANTSAIATKLEAGGYEGTAQDLKELIDAIDTGGTPELSNYLQKGGYSGTANDLDLAIKAVDSKATNLETNKLDKGTYQGTAQDLKDLIDSMSGGEAPDLSNYLQKGGYDGTANDLNEAIQSNTFKINAINLDTKLDKGDYTGTAKDLELAVNSKVATTTYESKVQELTTSIGTKLDKAGGTIEGNLTVTGFVYSNGNVSAFSDERVKENIYPVKEELDKLMEVDIVSFNYKGNDDKHYGVVAQQLETLYPELVVKTDCLLDNEPVLAVKYTDLLMLLFEKVKQQETRIKDLEARLCTL